MFFTKTCPLGGTKYVSFELILGILRGPREGRGGAPGTVPLQNPEVTSRKACLRNADEFGRNGISNTYVMPMGDDSVEAGGVAVIKVDSTHESMCQLYKGREIIPNLLHRLLQEPFGSWTSIGECQMPL